MPSHERSESIPTGDPTREEYARLKAERDRLRQLIDIAPMVFYMVDEDTRVLVANERAAQFYGVPLEELVGRTLIEVFGAERATEMMGSTYDTMQADKATYTPEEEQRDADGKRHFWELFEIPVRDQRTGRRAVLGVANDVTERREHERMTRDLEIAREIQRGLMPDAISAIEGFEVAGWTEAAEETGGDFYDWVELTGGQIFFSIADVSGHGIGSALVASICRAYARATLAGASSLEGIFKRLNQLLYDDRMPSRFVTYAAGVLDPRASRVRLLSAGHGPIVYYSARKQHVDRWNATNVPLAIVDDVTYDGPLDIEFTPGDVLLFVSDGFFEWANREGELFGVERLLDTVRRHASASAAELIEQLRNDVRAFTDGLAQTDDTTAVAVRCVST